MTPTAPESMSVCGVQGRNGRSTSDDGHLFLERAPELGRRDEGVDVGAEAGDELGWGRWFRHCASVGTRVVLSLSWCH